MRTISLKGRKRPRVKAIVKVQTKTAGINTERIKKTHSTSPQIRALSTPTSASRPSSTTATATTLKVRLRDVVKTE